MKIHSISYGTNLAISGNHQKPHQSAIANPIQAKSAMVEMPYYAMLANSAITFQGGSLNSVMPKTTTGVDIAELVNCAYCDRAMILSKKLFAIVWPSSEEPIKIYNKKMIEILEPFKEKMHAGELAVFDTIKDLNSQYPEKTFQQLLSVVRGDNLKKLNAKENKVLNNLNWITKHLPEEISTEMKSLIADSQSRILLDADNHPFKRKAFIEKLKDVLGVPTNEEIMQASTTEEKTQTMIDKEKKLALVGKEKALSIVDKAYQLPTSKDNKSAFIVKYASKVRKEDGTWSYRSTEEIAHNLLCSSRSTLDHLLERNPQNPLDPKGQTKAGNLAYVCDGCNSFLKENTKLSAVAKRYPQIPKNIQKQIDSLIYYTNNGTIIGGTKYVNDLATTYESLSTKKVNLRVDISKLNASDATPEDGGKLKLVLRPKQTPC